jgi:hypothetical protein
MEKRDEPFETASSPARFYESPQLPEGMTVSFDILPKVAASGNLGDQVADLLNNDRCQAFGGLVDHDEFGIAHERAANRQHLLLAARGAPPREARSTDWRH